MWLSNCLLCHNLIYWMHSLILVFIAGEWPGHFSISSLSYECKSLLPALEFKFASCPKCFITPSYLSISKNPRLWRIWEQSLDFYSVSVLVTLSHPPYDQVFFPGACWLSCWNTPGNLASKMDQGPCLSLFPGLFHFMGMGEGL